jgi:DNA-binding response OmpR family regulator
MADILVIDGDPKYRTSIVRILVDSGHQVHQAEDGVEGLAFCRRMSPALVITAIVMPEKDGIEIIRELSRETPDLPILAISGAVKASLYLRAATLLGAAASLRKPFSADELLIAVASVLSGRGNRQRKARSRSHRRSGDYRMTG